MTLQQFQTPQLHLNPLQYSGQYLKTKTKNHTQKQTTTTLLNMQSFLYTMKIHIIQFLVRPLFFNLSLKDQVERDLKDHLVQPFSVQPSLKSIQPWGSTFTTAKIIPYTGLHHELLFPGNAPSQFKEEQTFCSTKNTTYFITVLSQQLQHQR